jgi:DNA-binding response OmpR family regulator
MVTEPENKILLIEDSTSQALLFQRLLQRAGYHVFLSSDGGDGLAQACAIEPTLILLDVNLPVMNGLQVLSRLKRHHPTADIPVVMLSDCDAVSEVEQAIELGANGYLFKKDYVLFHGVKRFLSAIVQVLQGAQPTMHCPT